MWQKLCSVYDLKSEESLCLTQKKFFDFKWDTTIGVASNFSKIEQLTGKMKTLGGKISDSMVISRILSTLPPVYHHFHSAWDSTESAKRTLENLMTRLMTEESRIEKDATQDTTVALLSKVKITVKRTRIRTRNNLQNHVAVKTRQGQLDVTRAAEQDINRKTVEDVTHAV
ncbi:uncharacterized protein LOC123988365 [Osmia bicornis bicornis]|uniref:uncharacterized protein LOC123988365 n=1 Tax=Osmia bicornis bicornis TaxID=1437191 RepID=UPI001EAF2470|nr:uncharacterized protein LOC123988365 [Osmia bicornis bicornis]